MPGDDRSSRNRRPGRRPADGGSRGGPKGRGKRPGGRDDGRRGGRDDDRRGGRSDGRRTGPGERGRSGRRGDDRRDERGGYRQRFDDDRPPRTEAERRAADVRARRGPRRTPRTEEGDRAKIEERTTEEWIDEGSLRDAAEQATGRGSSGTPARRESPDVAPEVVAAIHDAVGPQRGAKLAARLGDAAGAVERERFGDAKRIVLPLVKELPGVAAVHEVHGLINYRQGNWKAAGTALETARGIDENPALLPVLADTYRARQQWDAVERIWKQLRGLSPNHEVMVEGRIIAASALADQGKVGEAIEMLESASTPPKRVRVYHLRQWYVLADLYDRAGESVTATRWFRLIAAEDPSFGDVRDRLRALGR